jgi:hypothetical protein
VSRMHAQAPGEVSQWILNSLIIKLGESVSGLTIRRGLIDRHSFATNRPTLIIPCSFLADPDALSPPNTTKKQVA